MDSLCKACLAVLVCPCAATRRGMPQWETEQNHAGGLMDHVLLLAATKLQRMNRYGVPHAGEIRVLSATLHALQPHRYQAITGMLFTDCTNQQFNTRQQLFFEKTQDNYKSHWHILRSTVETNEQINHSHKRYEISICDAK